MKKLNRKGFTLVELLAVIIILAIVVGITIPAVLTTTNKARQKAFDTAVDAIKTYIQDQVDMSVLPADTRDDNYNSAVATCTANCDGTTGGLLTVTGYNGKIEEIKYTITSSKVTITCATPTSNGDYSQGIKYSTAC